MKRIIACLVTWLVPALVTGQTTVDRTNETLSLESAIRTAVANNRQVKTALLQVEKAEEEIAAARTRRLPAFETDVTASQLLTPVVPSLRRRSRRPGVENAGASARRLPIAAAHPDPRAWGTGGCDRLWFFAAGGVFDS